MLRGTLDDFTLPEIFRVFSVARKTGRLDVTRSGGDGRVWFKGGDVYYGESSSSREPLGKKLTSRGVLTEDQLDAALQEHSSSGRRVGDILVSQGSVSRGQIEEAIAEQIEDTVFDLLRWDAGEFVWAPHVEASVEVGISISVEDLILEASRRLEEFHVVTQEIPSDDTVLMMAESAPIGAVEISIMPDEWRTLVLVDGIRTVAEIAALSGCEVFVAKRRLYGLLSAGLVQVDKSKKPEKVSEETAAPEAEVEETGAATVEDSAEAVAEQHVTEPEPDGELTAEEPESAQVLTEAAELAALEQDVDEPADASNNGSGVVEGSSAELFVGAGGSSTEEAEAEEGDRQEPTHEVVAGAASADETDDQPIVHVATDEEMATEQPDGDTAGEVVELVVEDAQTMYQPETTGEAEPQTDDHVEETPAEPQTAVEEAPAEPEVGSLQADLEELHLPSDPLDQDATATSPEEAVNPVAEMGAPAPREEIDQSDDAGSPETEADAPSAPSQPVVQLVPEPAPEAEPEAVQDLESVEPSSPPVPPGPAARDDAKVSSIDRAAAARELAGLFDDAGAPPKPKPAQKTLGGEVTKHRVEDDEDVTKSLISRLIDGVKGL